MQYLCLIAEVMSYNVVLCYNFFYIINFFVAEQANRRNAALLQLLFYLLHAQLKNMSVRAQRPTTGLFFCSKFGEISLPIDIISGC